MSQRPAHLKRLTAIKSDAEARIIIAALADNDIPATINADLVSKTGWVEILVAQEHLQRAQYAIEEANTNGADVDWSTVDVGEPDEAEDRNELEQPSPVRLRTESKFWRRTGIVLVVFLLGWLLLTIVGSAISFMME